MFTCSTTSSILVYFLNTYILLAHAGFISETLPTGHETKEGLLGKVNVPLIITVDWANQDTNVSTAVISIGNDLESKLEVCIVNSQYFLLMLLHQCPIL